MYAAGADHPLREPCRRALERAVERRVSLVSNTEILQEILHRYHSLRKPDIAQSIHRSAVRLCDLILPIEERHTARALEVLIENAEVVVRDAIHVATMEAAGIRRLLSADRDFDRFPQIQRVDPTEFLQ